MVTALAAILPVTNDAAGASSLTGAITASPVVATFLTVPGGPGTPHAVADAPLSSFPTNGGTFAILTTGNSAFADDANSDGFTGEALGGGNFRGDTDFDVSVLQIDLNVPAAANCLTFDFQFYSEEFPEFVGTDFNDAFIAELDASTWTTAGSVITAPNNFAFDTLGDVISINSTGVGGMNLPNAAGTTYDGATVLLSASTEITTPGAHTLYLSIFDQADQIYDSAVFVDNLVVGFVPDPAQNCAPGATPIGAFCGDGNLDAGEACDDGNAVDGDGCSTACVVEFCGDGNTDLGLGEACDDFNTTGGDGCSATCTIEACGNGTLDVGEACDDKNTTGGDGCSATCTIEACGNGTLDVGEACDDGNTISGDGCDTACVVEFCGDGIAQSGLGEACDDGNAVDGDGCDTACVVEFCGDGNTDLGLGEACDDFNTTGGDGCSATCTIEACGNGTLDVGEACDDKNTTGGETVARRPAPSKPAVMWHAGCWRGVRRRQHDQRRRLRHGLRC